MLAATLIGQNPVAGALFWTSFVVVFLIGSRGGRVSAADEARDEGTRRTILIMDVAAVVLTLAAASGAPSVAIPGNRWAYFVVGLVLIWSGYAVAEWAKRTLGSLYRPTVAVQPGHRVVSSGPYRVVRHPLYSGAMLAFLGLGIAFDNWIGLAACVVLPALGYVRRLLVEERALEATLGTDYVEYERGRSRLIPGIW